MKYVRLEKGIVAEIIPEFNPLFPDVPVSERYPQEFVKKLVKADDNAVVQTGMKRTESGGFDFIRIPVDINDSLTETVSAKLKELSSECGNRIIKGIEINGKQYSMDITDQLNMAALRLEIMNGAESVIYHADGAPLEAYTSDSFIEIYNGCQNHKHKETAYFNQLKQYVLSLGSTDAVRAVSYGQPLTGVFLETYKNAISIN